MFTKSYLKPVFIAILATVGISFSVVGEGPNLLINGDFELTEAPWGWKGNNADITYNDTVVANQINTGTCRLPGAAQARNINQDVEVSALGVYQFKCTARIQNSVGASGTIENNHATKGGPGTITAEILPFDTDGATLLSIVLATIDTQSNANTDLSMNVTIPEGVTKVKVRIKKDWNVVYIDDVVFNSLASGLRNPNIENLRVYSNTSGITINSSSTLARVRVFDISGKVVKSIPCNGLQQIVIPLYNVVPGLFLIEVADEHGNVDRVKQLIK